MDLTHSINANPATPTPDSADALEAGQGVNIGSGATIFCFHHFPPEQTLFGWILTEQHVRELANQGVDAGQIASTAIAFEQTVSGWSNEGSIF